MRTLKGLNHQWQLNLTLGDVIELRDSKIVSILEGDHEELLKIAFNLQTLGDVLSVLCREQIEKLNLTSKQFASDFTGEILSQARELLFEEITDFFQQSGSFEIAAFVQKIPTEIQKARQETANKITEKMNSENLIKNMKTGNTSLSS